MVKMTAVTTPMKTIVPLKVLVLVKNQRSCVRMVACVSIPAGFVTVKLIVTMVLMRKAATVSTSCLFIVLVCWSSIMIDLWSKSLRIVITNYGKFWISSCKSLCVIKVLNTCRRASGFDTQVKNWKGPLGLGMLCWKILKFYICRDVFFCILKFQTISFNCPKKITFLDNLIMIWYLH